MPHLCENKLRIIYGNKWRLVMIDVTVFLGDVLVGTLFAIAFAMLLAGYLWDFFRFSKCTTTIILLCYCIASSTIDQLTVLHHGIGVEHQIVYLLTICIIPYLGIYFLTKIPLVKYLYSLASVSI